MDKIGILGAGGMAREVVRYSSYDVEFFAVTREFLPTPAGQLSRQEGRLIDIEEPVGTHRNLRVVAAVGAPAVRRALVGLWPGNDYANVIARSAELFSEQKSKGIIIAPKSVITDNTYLGDHTIVNIGATVSHDCELGGFVTIGPGAHIGGSVRLEDGVFVGIGATIKNGIRVAEGSVVGAGAVVIKDVNTPNSVVVGNPAKTMRINEGWLTDV